MNKKISLGAAIAFMLIVATATFSMTMVYANRAFNEKVNALKDREVMFEKFSEIDRQVRGNFYGTIDPVLLMDSVAKGYVSGLGDPYSQYIDAKTYEKMLRDSEGNIVGIGAVIRSGANGYLEVEQVYTDSPAQAAGIESGDLIIKVDETDVTPENSGAMLEAIRGEPGTKISLVVRKGTEDIVLEPMTRRAVIIPTVSSRMLEGMNVGYIIIQEFGDNTSDQFNRELQKMMDAGAKSIIIDLRDNPGGNIRWAARILDKLLPAGLLASTTDRTGKVEPLFTSDANEIALPIVVITNANTASAAELFAQALKDFGKGRVVGAVTAGKGVIQEPIRLSDGSAVKLTIAQLNPPSGETFNKIGVKPDYEVSQEGDWKGLDDTSDAQLKKALEVALGMQKVGEAAQETSQTDAPTQGNTSAPQPAESEPNSNTPIEE